MVETILILIALVLGAFVVWSWLTNPGAPSGNSETEVHEHRDLGDAD